MGLLEKLKSAIGLTDSGSSHRSGGAETARQDVDVTVEHDPDAEPAAANEAAVKGTAGVGDDTSTGADPDAESHRGDDSSAGATADAAEGTETAGGTATTGGTDAETTETGASDATPESTRDGGNDDAASTGAAPTDVTTAESVEATDEESGVDIPNASAPVDAISGIGPAYAERLDEIDIQTVGDLAEADVAAVADGIDLSEKRVGRWIEDARNGEV